MMATRIMLAVILITAGELSAQSTQPAEVPNAIRRTATTATSANQTQAPTGIDTMRVLGSLAAVIGLILLLRWAVRRMGAGRLGMNSRVMQVIARCPISHKQQIVILQVGRKLLVVGDSGQQLTALSEISDPDEVAAVLGQMGRSGDLVTMLASSETTKPPAEIERQAPDEELSRAREQLNGLAEKVRVVARQLNRA
jgi:flagellar biosynthetic protein FliO